MQQKPYNLIRKFHWHKFIPNPHHMMEFMWNFLIRLYGFAALFYYEIFLRNFMLSCCYEMSLWKFSRFAAYFSDEIYLWDFMLIGRYEMSLWEFMLFAAQFSYEISWWDFILFWRIRALRLRLHAFLAVMRFPHEISCFLAAEFSCWWWDVRTEERWMLKDAGDRVYTIVSRTLHDFVCASFVSEWWI